MTGHVHLNTHFANTNFLTYICSLISVAGKEKEESFFLFFPSLCSLFWLVETATYCPVIVLCYHERVGWLGAKSPAILGDGLSVFHFHLSIYLSVFHCSPLFFPQVSLWLRSPHCLSPHHPPQPPPPACPNPLRQCVWSAPTIDRYIVPDRLDRATGQQTGGRGRQRARGGVGGSGECLFFCFQFGPARGTPHSAPSQTHHSWRPDVHGYTQMPTAHWHTHTVHVYALPQQPGFTQSHQPHRGNLSPSSSFIVPWFVITNAVPNYTPVNRIAPPSSASLNDFSPSCPQLWKAF